MTTIIEVKSLNSFNTVVAKSNIAKGEIITNISGRTTLSPSKYSLQISKTEHLLPHSSDSKDPICIWRFLNHSCEPNSFIDIQRMTLIALTDIQKDEEVRFNYNTTEFEIATPFNCHCNSQNCYGKVKGFRYLSKEEQKKLALYLAPHFQKKSSQLIL